MLERELAVLGLKPGAAEEDIRRAYRNLAKKYHPDLSGYNTASLFDKVTHAYKNLTVSKPVSRVIPYPARQPFGKQPSRETRDDYDISRLGGMLLYSGSSEQRAFAAKKLGNSGKKSAYVYLRKALSDKNSLVVRSSVEAIGKLRIQQSAGDLSCAFSHGEADTKLEILKALEAIGITGGFTNILLQAMRDPAPRVRRKGLSLFAETQTSKVNHG
ncbi:MAG: DnaJ domain-containing protein [Spirochaetales bacterium]|nr:DnaJ domain-containing protein [Spirochaetales bacterium]